MAESAEPGRGVQGAAWPKGTFQPDSCPSETTGLLAGEHETDLGGIGALLAVDDRTLVDACGLGDKESTVEETASALRQGVGEIRKIDVRVGIYQVLLERLGVGLQRLVVVGGEDEHLGPGGYLLVGEEISVLARRLKRGNVALVLLPLRKDSASWITAWAFEPP